jgi:hypothetical protein
MFARKGNETMKAIETIAPFVSIIGTVITGGITIWLAFVTRKFHTKLSLHTLRIETHQEAIRRARTMSLLRDTDPAWVSVMNEMIEWIDVNQVHLTPAAVDAFKDIQSYVGRSSGLAPVREKELLDRMCGGHGTLRSELLSFRPKTLTQ